MDEQEIQRRRREQDEHSTQQRGAILGLPYLDTREFEDSLALALDVMPIEKMHQDKMVPLVKGDSQTPFQFGVTAQTPQSVIQKMRQEYNDNGYIVQFSLISVSGYRALMLRYDPPKKIVYDDIEIAKEGDSDTIAEVSRTLNSVSSEELFDYIIRQADKLGASDIHIENERDNIRVRLRVDGALHPVAHLNPERYRIIMGELASRAGVSSASNESQSGHMQKEITTDQGTHLLNLRVETVPTLYGQDAVLRLFNFDESLLNLDLLGIPDKQRHEIDEVISHPRGLVLMVGPTGSGKSTTLYSIINALNDPSRKILTLEDPVEFDVPGISQIPVDTTNGSNFAEELRTVLRLDPDIVMVGEIRDNDTAKTAIQASITGHLVLATFHAQDAAAAFARMIDMIGTNPVFATAIRLVIGQRLVRRLDDDTKIEYEPDESVKDWIREVLRDLPESADKPDLDNIRLWKPGSSEENPFGYKGRVVLMEQLVVNEQISQFLRGDERNINVTTIERSAQSQGMVTMLQKGVLKALAGKTTLEEINRVL